MTTTTVNVSPKKSSLPVWLGVSGLLLLVGIVAWIIQLRQGVGATSLSNLNAWGIYIAGFIFFMGLSAGMLVLASLPVLFNLPRFRPYSKLAAYVALVSLIVGGLFILVDIGKPDRLWRIVRFGQLGSPMLWDLLLTIVYLLVATVFLRRLQTAKSDAALKPVALLAFLAGADGLTAFVFATQVGREFWFSAISPWPSSPLPLASAGALLLLLMIGLKAAGYNVLECCDLAPLARSHRATVGLGLLLEASEVITHWFSRSAVELEMVNAMLGSPCSGSRWWPGWPPSCCWSCLPPAPRAPGSLWGLPWRSSTWSPSACRSSRWASLSRTSIMPGCRSRQPAPTRPAWWSWVWCSA